MADFFKTLTVTAALISLAVLLLPEKEGIKKASISAFSLIFLILLFPKDGSFSLDTLLQLEDAAPVPDAGYEEKIKDAVVLGIANDLADRFALQKGALTLDTDLTATKEGVTGSYLRISLGQENFFADAGAILRYVKSTYGVDCEVNYYGS